MTASNHFCVHYNLLTVIRDPVCCFTSLPEFIADAAPANYAAFNLGTVAADTLLVANKSDGKILNSSGGLT